MTMRCKGQAAVRTAEILWAVPGEMGLGTKSLFWGSGVGAWQEKRVLRGLCSGSGDGITPGPRLLLRWGWNGRDRCEKDSESSLTWIY